VSPNSTAFKIEYRAKEVQEFDTKEDLIAAIQSKKMRIKRLISHKNLLKLLKNQMILFRDTLLALTRNLLKKRISNFLTIM
jgi:hypothetical protein